MTTPELTSSVCTGTYVPPESVAETLRDKARQRLDKIDVALDEARKVLQAEIHTEKLVDKLSPYVLVACVAASALLLSSDATLPFLARLMLMTLGCGLVGVTLTARSEIQEFWNLKWRVRFSRTKRATLELLLRKHATRRALVECQFVCPTADFARVMASCDKLLARQVLLDQGADEKNWYHKAPPGVVFSCKHRDGGGVVHH